MDSETFDGFTSKTEMPSLSFGNSDQLQNPHLREELKHISVISSIISLDSL